ERRTRALQTGRGVRLHFLLLLALLPLHDAAQSSAERQPREADPGAAAAPPGYPARPVRLIAGTSPGGVTDLLARMAALGIAPGIGQNVVVDNRPGATGNVGIEIVSKSPPDGHT